MSLFKKVGFFLTYGKCDVFFANLFSCVFFFCTTLLF
jgi:hypothetical protein